MTIIEISMTQLRDRALATPMTMARGPYDRRPAVAVSTRSGFDAVAGLSAAVGRALRVSSLRAGLQSVVISPLLCPSATYPLSPSALPGVPKGNA
jgi:hypothetical protein